MKKTYMFVALGVGLLALTLGSVAMAAGSNYGNWRTMMGGNGGRASQVVTEKNFDQFTQMHKLMAEGRYDEAFKIRNELGLGQGRSNRGGGCGMNAGNAGSCPMRNGGSGAGFIDVNGNGICDHAENLTK